MPQDSYVIQKSNTEVILYNDPDVVFRKPNLLNNPSSEQIINPHTRTKSIGAINSSAPSITSRAKKVRTTPSKHSASNSSTESLSKKKSSRSRTKNKIEFLPVKFQTGIDFMLMDSTLRVKCATIDKLMMLLTYDCFIGIIYILLKFKFT